jgi:hypothetical protein
MIDLDLIILLVIVAPAVVIPVLSGALLIVEALALWLLRKAFILCFTLLLRIILLPLRVTHFVLRRRMVPMTQRNLTRASGGAFILTFVAVVASRIQLDQNTALAAGGVGAIAMVYVAVGYRGARGAPCDSMAVIWWSVGAACSAALLLMPGKTQFDHTLLQAVACAGIAACLLRVWLLLRPLPGATLPHPSKIPGMPMAGPASLNAAHAALGRRGRGARPKFKV